MGNILLNDNIFSINGNIENNSDEIIYSSSHNDIQGYNNNIFFEDSTLTYKINQHEDMYKNINGNLINCNTFSKPS